jgi:hypothetical protein
MFKLKISFFVSLLALISFTACHKHEDVADTIAPVLTITAPTEDASNNGAVAIKGTITDEGGMHEMSLKITKDSDNTVLFSATPTVHDKTTFTLAETWTPTGITVETAVTLTVNVEDHSANKTEKIVKFKVK